MTSAQKWGIWMEHDIPIDQRRSAADEVTLAEQRVIGAAFDYMAHHDAHRFVQLQRALKYLEDAKLKFLEEAKQKAEEVEA